MASVKALVQSQDLKSLPSDYAHFKDSQKSIVAGPEVSLPVIDFSLLSSTNPDERAKVIEDLGKACEEWGFFMVVNHGIPENLINSLFNVCNEFFDMPEEEKLKFETTNPLYPVMVRSGSTIHDKSNQTVLFWRDYLRFFVHPEFYCPDKPQDFRDLISEYSQRTRDLACKLLQGISQSLGMEEDYIQKAMGLDHGTQIFAANYYPPCPQPELAIGIPPHTDHGLLTFLLQNGVGGLEIQHEGQWFHVNALPNSIFVNTADQLEVLSNGKYKSVWHRAVVNNEKTRITLVVPNGPSPDTIVTPAAPLLREAPAAYGPMKYMEYVNVQRVTRLHEKPLLDRLKLH
ncbi:unnamed protein product [Coffea canephora]|uniref:Fe2OG dioxygenase domain-containing protein n=1 Tax=Coffea canephora TaxID=49390 RepID=A0A068TPW1_COFCA|nr:unnamed protein product [Coffea canephora]